MYVCILYRFYIDSGRKTQIFHSSPLFNSSGDNDAVRTLTRCLVRKKPTVSLLLDAEKVWWLTLCTTGDRAVAACA